MVSCINLDHALIILFSILPKGINTLAIEIYDECFLKSDECIAHALHTIPDAYFDATETLLQSVTYEHTLLLSGKLGDDQEGELIIVVSLKVIYFRVLVAISY